MIRCSFGNSQLETSILGFGAGQIGDARLSDTSIEKLLNEILDLGINLIDTARGYGLSEERIGRFISHRREEFIISTKVGYNIDGMPDWTYDTIIAGVDHARKRLESDVIDIVHLHSCPKNTMVDNYLFDAMQETIERGWIKIPAYSGENEDLTFAIDTNRIGSLQTSVNIFDQRDIDTNIANAKQRGIGIIAKRTIGNTPWQFIERPVGHYCEAYWERMQVMGLQFDMPMLELALRFTTFSAGVDCALVGTTNIQHLKNNVGIIEKGPLPIEIVESIRESFRLHDDGWIGQL